MKLQWIKRNKNLAVGTIQLSETVRVEASVYSDNDDEWYPEIQVVRTAENEQEFLMFFTNGDCCDGLNEAQLVAQDFVDFLDQHMDAEIAINPEKAAPIKEAKALFLAVKNGNAVG